MKRNEPTIVQKAIETIEGFDRVYKTLYQQTVSASYENNPKQINISE